MWGSLNDPADPKSDNYQGYETIEDPDKIAPVETDIGIVTYVPKLVATKVAGATAYQFRISSSADSASYLYESAEVTVNEYLPVDCFGLSATITYYWFVRAKVGGTWGAWSEELATFSLSTAESDTASPVNLSTITDTTPDFDWSDVAGATGYRIQISAVSDFTTTVADDATLTASAYTQSTALTNNSTYYWRVLVKNVDGVWSAWIDSKSFTVEFGAILELSHAAGGPTSVTTPFLDWADATNAVSYIVQIATTEGSLSSAIELSTMTSAYQTTDILIANDTRWWRVCAVNASNQRGFWSDAMYFTIISPPLLLTPTNGVSATSARPTFTWTAVEDAASYEIAIATSEAGLVDTTTIPVSGTNWTPTNDFAPGTWYWYVMCVDAYGVKWEWSGAWSFERPYSIGDTGPAGGKVFYDKGTFSSGWRYLEAAPRDQSLGISWNSGSYMMTGANSTAIGTGEANTDAIVSVLGAGLYAASLCADLTLGGYNDWFLPSIDELNVLYGQEGIVGGFTSDGYWSSSEYNDDPNYAWLQYFYDGYQTIYGKSYYRKVRAIRAF